MLVKVGMVMVILVDGIEVLVTGWFVVCVLAVGM